MPFPRLIALCGKPLAGKTTAAEILHYEFNYTICDDGLPLRQIAMNYLGLNHSHVFTQEGKLETVMLNGRRWQTREILGEIGNAFEDKFGGDVIPMMSHNIQDPRKFYVMSSVRREQGAYWARVGALVIEIDKPGLAESAFEFDCYNPDHVHLSIINDTMDREDLRSKLTAALVNNAMAA
jgi:hypothetical protein